MKRHEEMEMMEDVFAGRGKDEQTQRLLDEEEHEQEQEQDIYLPKRWPWRISLLICCFAAVGAGLLVTAVFGITQEMREAQHEVVEALSVQGNDYVLSKDWDYNAPAQKRQFHWTIRNQVHNPDGVFREMLLAENQFPGPLIECNDGDTIEVKIENRGINSTAIHFHGLYQNGTSYMDGTVGISQCPIAPGATFTYKFKVQGQHGTTWWHGHHGVQAADGLFGPIVIHSPKEKKLQQIEAATDRVIMLSDHYHDLSSALMFQYLMPDKENAEPVPQTGLFNGQAIRDCDLFSHRKCDNTTTNVGLPSFDLSVNQNHRLRLINAGVFAEFQFQIDNHELLVTEVDGTDVQPQAVDRLDINPAQRYSVIVRTNVTGAQRFWMRARMIEHCFTDPPDTLQAEALAVVNYGHAGHANHQMPQSQPHGGPMMLECRDMNVSTLVPSEVIPAPAEPDEVFYIRSNFEIGAYRLSRGFFNTTSWRADVRRPSLHRVVEGLASGNTSYSTQAAGVNTAAFDIHKELVLQTTGIKTIDLLYSNFDDGVHPLHLHGYKFFILAQGQGAPPLTRIDAAINRESLQPLYETLDLSNPLRRDTASVPAFGWILLRVIADNPGAWALHCHVSWHAEAGLVMQLITRSDELAKTSIPRANLELCNANGLEKGMPPLDEQYEQFAK